ncbi:hypothetical protein A4A49_19618 [Nicotiana attenuata]|uniref:Uncharacterized protein n=1 Tax=Nicotiana attenuata TaxID=49451 RepID=A0A1J6INW5_NICAT|nr:hypothetical protein A4A49_19618 [Nicotiana attenuata]
MVLIREGVLSTDAAAVSNCEVVRSTAAGVIEDSTAPNTTAPVFPIEDALKLDKGPPKPSRDVPASTVFARMYLATAGALQEAIDRAKISKVPGDVKQDKLDAGAVDCATVLPGRYTSVGSDLHNFNRAGFQASIAALHKAVKPAGGTSNDAIENEKHIGLIDTTKHVQGQGFTGVSVLDNTTDATLDKQTVLKGTTMQNEGQEHEDGENHNGKNFELECGDTASKNGDNTFPRQKTTPKVRKQQQISNAAYGRQNQQQAVVHRSLRNRRSPSVQEQVPNSNCKQGVDVNREECRNSVTLELIETSGIKPSDRATLMSSKKENGKIVGMSLQEVKENNCMAGVGLNKSQHDIPSNELFDRSGNMLQVSNNQQTLSMISSETKKKGADVMSEAELSDEPVQILNKLHEAISSTRKLWVDQTEEYEEGEDYVGDAQEQNTQETCSSTRRDDNTKEGAITVFEQRFYRAEF